MATKEEIKAKILSKLTSRQAANFTSTVAQMSQPAKDDAQTALINRDTKMLGKIIIAESDKLRKSAADQRADQLLANNSLDLDELDEVL